MKMLGMNRWDAMDGLGLQPANRRRCSLLLAIVVPNRTGCATANTSKMRIRKYMCFGQLTGATWNEDSKRLTKNKEILLVVENEVEVTWRRTGGQIRAPKVQRRGQTLFPPIRVGQVTPQQILRGKIHKNRVVGPGSSMSHAAAQRHRLH